jgi:hypothetical protein
MEYLRRILLAQKRGLPLAPGEFLDSDIQHDVWCPILRGVLACYCDPNITVRLESGGAYRVFADGSFARVV